ncbi:tRNA-Phe hydroxylase [Aureococcus anophagefferens]|nr:tRNA-Phe hydroxylase [Aureococcus anophagefferens]
MQLATGKSKRYRFWQTPEFKAAVCFGLALASLCYLGYQLYDPRYAGPSDDDVAKPYVAVHASTVGAPHEKRGPDPGATRRWRVGESWGGQWRASSEPGGAYMAGRPLEPHRVGAFIGGADAATRSGFYATPSGDSVAVEAVAGNCSSYGVAPPAHYPAHYPITQIIENWPPDSVAVPPRHFASLCVFDHEDEIQRRQATAFRKKELPFVVRHIGEVDAVVKEWSTPGVLERRLGTKYYRCERSDDNHFMYHGGHGGLRGWSSPTENVQMRYADWLAYARNAYNTTVLEDHYYFRVSPPDMTPKDVPIFSRDDPLFMPKFKESKGVHCRFGYAGIIAEAHFDGSRNMVVELGGPPESLGHFNSGRRRYMLARPLECRNAYLLPKGHPSGRHSEIDWSRPVDGAKFPKWAKMRALEVVLEPGDVLYIPGYWIHCIMSLGTNFQCNSRSGHSTAWQADVGKCGF